MNSGTWSMHAVGAEMAFATVSQLAGEQLIDTIPHPALQRWPEVPRPIRHLFQIACDGKDNVEVIPRGGKKVGEQLELLDVIHDELWSEDVYQAWIHTAKAKADGTFTLYCFLAMKLLHRPKMGQQWPV